MSIQEQRRARFEEWILSDYMSDGDRDLVSRDNDGEYCSIGVAERWETYNAALDSVVIELPDTVANTGTLTSTAVLGYKRECREAIEAAGLKVKP